MNRRNFMKSAAVVGGIAMIPQAFGQNNNIDPSTIINISNPQSHCNQDHAHDPVPPGIDPYAQLNWSAGDTGYNEGADEAVSLLARYGIGLPPPVDTLAGKAAGNLWKRRDMMAFAKQLAKSGSLPPAVGLAILSQWHNCHAFRTLIVQVPAVINWLYQ